MNTTFWFIAGLMTGVTATAVSMPLWRGLGAAVDGSRRKYVVVAGGLVIFACSAAAIYLAVGAPATLGSRPSVAMSAGSAAQGKAGSMEEATARLASRLERDGGSAGDWELLAKSYDFLGRPADASRARAHIAMPPARAQGDGTAPQLTATEAARLAGTFDTPATAGTPSPNVTSSVTSSASSERVKQLERQLKLDPNDAQAWADYADVLGTRAGGSLSGVPATAIERALALDPANSKALWLDATLALQQHRYDEALTLWKRLRDVLEPGSRDAQLVDANIAEAQQLAQSQSSTPSQASAQSATTGGTSGANTPAAQGPAEISGTVSIESRLAGRVNGAATLFVYAKAVDSPGPPLAVTRMTASSWPVSFRLDDSMAMIPSRRLSQFQKVIVEARISRSGQATPAAGDLYVTSSVLSPSAGKKLALVINHEIG